MQKKEGKNPKEVKLGNSWKTNSYIKFCIKFRIPRKVSDGIAQQLNYKVNGLVSNETSRASHG